MEPLQRDRCAAFLTLIPAALAVVLTCLPGIPAARAQDSTTNTEGPFFQFSGQAGINISDVSAGYGLGFLVYEDQFALSGGWRRFVYGPKDLPEDYEIKGKPGLVDIHDRIDLYMLGVGYFEETAHDEVRLLLAAHAAWGRFDEAAHFRPVDSLYWFNGKPNYTHERQAGNTGGLHLMGRIEYAARVVSFGLFYEIYITPKVITHLGGIAVGIGRQRRNDR